jgi:hypothetical protein
MNERQAREIATVFDYPGFISACRARIDELGIGVSSESAAEISGLHKDHLAKLMSSKALEAGRYFTPWTLGPVLGLLAMRLVLVEDPGALKRLSRRLEKRSSSHVRNGSVTFSIPKAKLKENGTKGGKNSRAFISAKASRAIARRAAIARFPNGKAAKRTAARLKAWETRRARAQAKSEGEA